MPGKRILLVEDDVDIRENMASVLEYEGYQVQQAEHGIAALHVLKANRRELPDIILLDLFMPIMNGREFLDAIIAHNVPEWKKIPVILITASEQHARQDLEMRTLAVIRKPIDLKSFLTLLSSVLA